MKKNTQRNESQPTFPGQGEDLAQPDERDQTARRENADRTIQGPRQMIEQAASDIAHGLVDTDLHGHPSNVPGPVTGGPQADVPPEGGNRRTYADSQIRPEKDAAGGKA